MATIQWFPGHMTKARRMIEQELKLVDVVIELVDARIPESSRNPLLGEIIGKKRPRLIILNMLLGRGMTTTGNKPGVTKGKQWVRLTDDIELLDTPGLLWHKFEDEEVGNKLAMTGAISDEVFVWEDVAFRFLQIAQARYAALIAERYSLDAEEVAAMDTYELMQTIGRKRGAIVRGGKVDDLKTAHIIIKDFRDNKIGRITLE